MHEHASRKHQQWPLVPPSALIFLVEAKLDGKLVASPKKIRWQTARVPWTWWANWLCHAKRSSYGLGALAGAGRVGFGRGCRGTGSGILWYAGAESGRAMAISHAQFALL